jgi:hypothetical protein
MQSDVIFQRRVGCLLASAIIIDSLMFRASAIGFAVVNWR